MGSLNGASCSTDPQACPTSGNLSLCWALDDQALPPFPIARGFPGAVLLMEVAFQSAGAMAGGGIALAVTDGSKSIHYGYPTFGKSYLGQDLSKNRAHWGWGTCFLVEALGTALLAATVLQVACRNNQSNGYYGMAIGFSVVVSIYAFGAISGGCFNPAVGLLATLASDVEANDI